MRMARLLALSCCAAPVSANAQVIEIDASGKAQTYHGPTLFVDVDPTPIGTPRSSATSTLDARTLLADAAKLQGLQPGLLEAVAWQESRGRMSAVSVKGALGVMQLMPGTAAELGVRADDLAENIRGGALYLRRQLDRFGSVPLALAAYNAGPGAVMRYRGIPPYRETQNYVASILSRWRPVSVQSTAVSVQSTAVTVQSPIPDVIIEVPE